MPFISLFHSPSHFRRHISITFPLLHSIVFLLVVKIWYAMLNTPYKSFNYSSLSSFFLLIQEKTTNKLTVVKKIRTVKKMWCIFNNPSCPWYLISHLPSYFYIWRYFQFISAIAFNCITSCHEILISYVNYPVWNPFLHLFLSSFFGLKNFLSHSLYGLWKTLFCPKYYLAFNVNGDELLLYFGAKFQR